MTVANGATVRTCEVTFGEFNIVDVSLVECVCGNLQLNCVVMNTPNSLRFSLLIRGGTRAEGFREWGAEEDIWG